MARYACAYSLTHREREALVLAYWDQGCRNVARGLDPGTLGARCFALTDFLAEHIAFSAPLIPVIPSAQIRDGSISLSGSAVCVAERPCAERLEKRMREAEPGADFFIFERDCG